MPTLWHWKRLVNRKLAADGFFYGSIVGWPLTQFTVARHEPPFVLALSWLAIILTAWDIRQSTAVRNNQEKE